MSENENFPKNYDFAAVEPTWIQKWQDGGLFEYHADSAAAKAGKVYSVDTPPPYVSAAHLHVGHAMSYSQAEFVVRFKRMRGHEIYYPMGFDDNGLPTERYVEQKFKVNKAKITRKEFIELCLAETRAGAKVYQDLWMALGLSVDWRMTYSTIQPRAMRHAQTSFLDLMRKGRIERREDPILWCPTCATALAQADVETGDEIDRPMHTVLFDVAQTSVPAGQSAPAAGLIETTRPELVPACVALACHPDDARFNALKGLRFAVPLTDLRADTEGQPLPADQLRTIPLVFDAAVDPEFGTGLMMVCTFGDPEDIAKWRAHGLDTVLILDPQGRMVTPNLPTLHGQRVHVPAKGSQYSEARLAAVELLKAHGYLGPIRSNVSRASVHERCSTPVEIQVAPQWFIRLLDLKEPLIERGRELRWFPEFMRERYEDWVTNLKWDWNISRQRFYGVPFPVWYCESCNAPSFATEAELPIDPMMSACPREKCAKCGGTSFRAEPDVMDTWMTSSLTPLLNANWAMWQDKQDAATPMADRSRPEIYPMGVRVQAFEIIRTWLFYTVAKSHLHTDSLPWRDVMISGWGLDRAGKKMSKRAGNFVDPAEVIAKYSADALRYWAAGATLGHDLRYIEDDVKGGKRLLTKLWNSTRFAMTNLEGWQPGAVAEEPTAADLWIRSRLVDVIGQATEAYEQYEYSKALRATEGFFWKDWCDNYLEIVKERFRGSDRWTAGQQEAGRRTIMETTYALLRLFAPVLPFLTEELYFKAIVPFLGEKAAPSIHVAAWPQREDGAIDVFGGARDVEAEKQGDLLITLVGAVRQCKTAAKLGGGRPLDVVYVQATAEQRAELAPLERDWLAASRAEAWSFAAPQGEHVGVGDPVNPVGVTGICIGIVAAPADVAPVA
jgi:valyl-tRNA synthetase